MFRSFLMYHLFHKNHLNLMIQNYPQILMILPNLNYQLHPYYLNYQMIQRYQMILMNQRCRYSLLNLNYPLYHLYQHYHLTQLILMNLLCQHYPNYLLILMNLHYLKFLMSHLNLPIKIELNLHRQYHPCTNT